MYLGARRGVITHLTIHGERVAAIVPESVIEALRAAEDAAEADAAMDEPGESIPWEHVKAELDLWGCLTWPPTRSRSGRAPGGRCGSSIRPFGRRSPRSLTGTELAVGTDEVAELEQAVTLFRRWDASGAGALRRKAVVGQLNAVAESLNTHHPPAIAGRLFQVTAELAQLVDGLRPRIVRHGPALLPTGLACLPGECLP